MTQHRLYGLRGKAYVAKYKEILSADGDAIARRFHEIVASHGKFTPLCLGMQAREFRLPLSLLDDCLPSLTDGRYLTGTWERLKDRGLRASDIGVSWNDVEGDRHA